MAEQLEVLTGDTFANYIKEHDAVILFHKKFCPHCAVMGTVLGKVMPRMAGVSFASVDSEEQPDLMAAAGVARVPTLVIVKNGEIRDQFTGIKKPAEVISWYNSI